MNILVTGGCGYIGSHMAVTLLRAGHDVTMIDVSPRAVGIPREAQLFVGDVVNYRLVSTILRANKIDAVMHFAGRIQVADSLTNPRAYYRDNLAAGISLIDACLDAGVKKFIFSSSAAVYGQSPRLLMHPYAAYSEGDLCYPISPYGRTKLMFEKVLDDYDKAYGLRSVSLRYFNAAGAREGLRERHEPETHLIPLALDAARDLKLLTVYGTDYPTADGTAVRDYVHVADLCAGHLKALEYLEQGGETEILNLGSGKGTSVREVIAAAERVTKCKLGVVEAPQRPGDPPALVADITRARRLLDWKPELSSIDRIVHDAWASRK